jgi:hypothetical protein
MQLRVNEIVYLASRDGWSTAKFHAKCDGRSNIMFGMHHASFSLAYATLIHVWFA